MSWANGFVVIVIVVDDDSEEVVRLWPFVGAVLCCAVLAFAEQQCSAVCWMGRARAKRHQSELYRASDLLSAAADKCLTILARL